MSGTSRGGGWVAAQFLLIGLIVIAGLLGPHWPEGARVPLAVVGIGLAVAGIVVAVRAARALGRSLTPFPLPAAAGTLVQHGGYSVVRHPIYTGGLLFLTGFSLGTGAAALAFTAPIAVLWALKARVEERHLVARYPAYAAYCRQVRWRLLPYVY